jgi:CheY-like chemotaxis protein
VKKIIIVDDMKMLRDFYKRQITSLFSEVEICLAADAIEAMSLMHLVDLTEGDEILCLISDFKMGPIDGLQLSKKIRKRLPGTSIFVHSDTPEKEKTEYEREAKDLNVVFMDKLDSMNKTIIPWLEKVLNQKAKVNRVA